MEAHETSIRGFVHRVMQQEALAGTDGRLIVALLLQQANQPFQGAQIGLA